MDADPTDGRRVVPVDGALAGMGVGHGDPRRGREGAQLLGGLGVDDPTAGDERADAGPTRMTSTARARAAARDGPADVPDPPGEEGERPVVRLGLDVLREAERDGAGVGGSVRTRIAFISEGMSCSGRVNRSKKRETGRKTSLTLTSRRAGVLELLEDGVRDAAGRTGRRAGGARGCGWSSPGRRR